MGNDGSLAPIPPPEGFHPSDSLLRFARRKATFLSSGNPIPQVAEVIGQLVKAGRVRQALAQALDLAIERVVVGDLNVLSLIHI